MVDEIFQRLQFYSKFRLDNKLYVKLTSNITVIFRPILIELQHHVQFVRLGDCYNRNNHYQSSFTGEVGESAIGGVEEVGG